VNGQLSQIRGDSSFVNIAFREGKEGVFAQEFNEDYLRLVRPPFPAVEKNGPPPGAD
jgi:hypothetical protein